MNKLLLVLLFISSVAYAKYENIQTYEDHKNELKYKTILGHSIAYIDEGEGTPIVLLHGIPTNSWMYRKIIPQLAIKNYRVIVPDLLGMGASEKLKNKEELSVKEQAKIILSLIRDELKISDWKMVIHDFGGPITWEMAELDGFKINELIVLNTFAFEEGWNPGLNIFTKILMNIATTKPLDKTFYKQAIKSMLFDSKRFPKEQLSSLIDGYIEPLHDGGTRTYKTLYFSANKLKKELPRYQETLKRLSKTPTKIIWGKHDKFLSSSEQLEQIQAILKTKKENVLILEDSKHLITEESSEEIVSFITSL